jgi:uncharacterized protein YoxC
MGLFDAKSGFGRTALAAGTLGISEMGRKDSFSDMMGAHAEKRAKDAKNAQDASNAQQARSEGLNKSIDTMEGRNTQYDVSQEGRNNKYKGIRDTSYDEMKNTSAGLQNRMEGLRKQSEENATNSNRVYTDLGTKMDGLVNQQKANSDAAMSLKDYSNASTNKVFNDTRGIYNDQAQNEGKQGQADFGVLSSLGAKAMGSGMAGMGPMTAGAQSMMMANSQRQAGEAYAGTQRRMQDLRDQGLNMGFNRMDTTYQAGRQANNDYQNSIGARGNMQSQSNNEARGFRGEADGYNNSIAAQRDKRSGLDLSRGQENYGMDTGFAQDKIGRANSITGQRMGVIDADYASKMGQVNATASQQAAARAQQAGYVNAGIGAAGTIGGAVLGGPAGAAAGGAVAGGVANAANPSTPVAQNFTSPTPMQSNGLTAPDMNAQYLRGGQYPGQITTGGGYPLSRAKMVG